MKLYRLPFYGFFYRLIMRVAHRFHWHYAPPSYPDGDTLLWCHWCGLRQVVKRRDYVAAITNNEANAQKANP